MRLALVLDPRFPGGTSSAVAQEIAELSDSYDLRVIGLETRHFKGRHVNPRLEAAMTRAGLHIEWAPAKVSADVIAIHNPAAFKFDTALTTRFVARQLYVVAHENFLRPNGEPGFDVARSLRLIARNTLAQQQLIAPVSAYNRETIERWRAMAPEAAAPWHVAAENWFNICEFQTVAPTHSPRDRRGRVSRVGFEKFPARAVMERHFPPHAEYCAILGADNILDVPEAPPAHWQLYRFGEREVAGFLEEIDFFVYFPNPCLRESFGRVIVEAIAAGKLVITDTGTAQTFGPAVIASDGHDLDEIIARYTADPASYVRFVEQAQIWMQRFSGRAFRASLHKQIEATERMPSALL